MVAEIATRRTLLRWAAALIDPARAEALLGPSEGVDGGALAELLQRNKVPLLSLATGPLAGRLESAGPAWAEAVAAEEREFAAQRAEFACVQVALREEGIPHLLIKAVGCPPNFPYRSDNWDLLIRPQDTPRVRCLLEGLDYVELRNVEEEQKYIFRRFAAGRSIGVVHLHERVGWGTGFMDEGLLWSRARPAPEDESLLIPAPGDALLITLAHAFYEDKRISLGDLQRILWCLRREVVDWPRVKEVAVQRGWYPGYLAAVALAARAERDLYGETLWPPAVLEAVRAELPAWARSGLEPLLQEAMDAPPWRVPFRYSKRHYFHKLAADRMLPVCQKLSDAIVHVGGGLKRKLHVHSQRPFLVAFSGVDGSGKTAHIEALLKVIELCELQGCRSWSRLASSPLSARLLAWGRRLSGQVQRGGQALPPQERLAARRGQLRSPLLRAGFVWLMALDLWLGYLRQIVWPLWRGRIVLADRYILDAAAELGQILNHPAPQRLWAIRVLRFLSPRPHQAYLLEVPAQVAAARSATAEAPELLAEQAALQRALAAEWGVVVVDNSQPFDLVGGRLARDILRPYGRDFRTALNGLFFSNPKRRSEGGLCAESRVVVGT